VQCQVTRGTRQPDGTLILKNPQAPGSRERRDSRRVREEIAGVNERAVLELLDIARRVDIALAGLEAARAEAEAAVAEWQGTVEAIARLPELAVASATRVHGA